MRKKNSLLNILVIPLFLLALSAEAEPVVLIKDAFDRNGVLYGSRPSGGTNAVDWAGANHPSLSTDGSVLMIGKGVRAGFLPLPLKANSGVYTLTVTVALTSTVDPESGLLATGGLIFGFVNSTDEATRSQANSSSYVAGVTYRNDGKFIVWSEGEPYQRSSIVTGMANGAKPITFTISVDTGTGSVKWSDSEHLLTVTQLFKPEELASITGIKLGANGAEGSYDDLLITREAASQ